MASILPLTFQDKKDLSLPAGYVPVFKFAESINIDTGDGVKQIWNQSHNLTYLSTATELYLTSDDNTDDQTFFVVAMDKFFEYESYSVTLNGFTPVSVFAGKKFIRVIRVENSNGSATSGNVYCSTGSGGYTDGVPNAATDIQAYVAQADQQTLMSHFTIPGEYWGVLSGIRLGIINDGNTSATSADIRLKIRCLGGTFLTKAVYPISSAGTSYANITFHPGRLIQPKCDIRFDCADVGRNVTRVSCDYSIELYKKENMPSQPIQFIPE